LEFDAGASQRLERIYTTPDVVEQRRAVVAALGLHAGERVVDIGCGPALLAAVMAAQVGPSGHVSGVDVSDSMLALARARAESLSELFMDFQRGGAQELPFPDQSFDVAVSTQVLEYVPDIAAAVAEMYRVLRPGGRVLLLDTDWDTIVWHSTDPARTHRILTAWDEHLVHKHLPRTLKVSLEEAGFEVTRTQVFPLLNVGYDVDTYSAGMLQFICEFVVGRQGITQADADAWRDDLQSMGGGYFFSLNRYLFCATRAG
jgi:ubiquinone/menaquinone biosynthesis C-methylase UbiE